MLSQRKKRSDLEYTFEENFKKKFLKAGFKFESEVVIPGESFRYDFRFTKGRCRILLEIDGNGMGHSSVAAKERDARKGNHAFLSGYVFFRLTTKHFRTVKGVQIPDTYAHELVRLILIGGLVLG